jgi:3-hydroxybutyryl-CoA dehydrogenase
MQIGVITNDSLKEELIAGGINPGNEINWLDKIDKSCSYDVIIDLLFENTLERRSLLKASKAKLVIINSVEYTLEETDPFFVRICGWPTFLKGNIIEASSKNENRQLAEEIFSIFNKKIEWLPDLPGFITPRVISMIINEAFFALEEEVSSRNDIDIAMKSGTNYPYGPFEWASIIGTGKITSLLKKLSLTEARYSPAPLLLKELE